MKGYSRARAAEEERTAVLSIRLWEWIWDLYIYTHISSNPEAIPEVACTAWIYPYYCTELRGRSHLTPEACCPTRRTPTMVFCRQVSESISATMEVCRRKTHLDRTGRQTTATWPSTAVRLWQNCAAGGDAWPSLSCCQLLRPCVCVCVSPQQVSCGGYPFLAGGAARSTYLSLEAPSGEYAPLSDSCHGS